MKIVTSTHFHEGTGLHHPVQPTEVLLVLVGGLFHLRHSIRVAEEAIRETTVDQIPALRDECVRVFGEAFGETLDLQDFEGSAEILSARLDHPESLKQPFAREACYWHFVLPVGAFVGELLRVHCNAVWREADDEFSGGLEIAIPVGDDVAQTYPFQKVIKHVTSGDPGDVYAYFLSSKQLDKITEHLDSDPGDGAA